MVAFIVLIGIIFGGVKLLAIANNISDNEAMDKYSGKLFVVGIIVFIILMCVIGNNDDGFNYHIGYAPTHKGCTFDWLIE